MKGALCEREGGGVALGWGGRVCVGGGGGKLGCWMDGWMVLAKLKEIDLMSRKPRSENLG